MLRVLLLFTLFSGYLIADSVKLKNGKSIRGKIISTDKSKVLIVEEGNGNNVSFYDPKEIDSIESDSNSVSESNDFSYKIFGLLKSEFRYSDNAVLSYGIENQISPTSVKRQVMARDSLPRGVITAANSKIGLNMSYKGKAHATFLFDLADLSQSNAIISAKPRVMIALASYTPTGRVEIFGGQTFDIFSDLIPHTYNYSGLMNESGNAGFTRQQFGVKYKLSKVQLAVAAGMPNINFNTPGPSQNSDLNSTPTLAGNIKIAATEKINIHLSAITVDLKVRQPLYDTNRDGLFLEYDIMDLNSQNKFANTFPQAYRWKGDGTTRLKSGGYSFGFDGEVMKNLAVRGEINYGQNLDSISASGLSRYQTTNYSTIVQRSELGVLEFNDPYLTQVKNYQAPIFKSIREIGGWISLDYTLNEKISLGVHGSAAKIINQKDLNSAASSNLYKSQTNTTFWNVSSILGGIRENSVKGYRLSYKPEDFVTFFFQHDYMVTLYKESKRDQGLLNHISSIDVTTGATTLRNVEFPYLKVSARAASHMIYMGIMIPF